MAKNILALGFVIFFSLVAGFSLLHPGLHPTHDGEYHIIRFYEFDRVLREGNMYPRWAPDLNNAYGVPLFNFVYPLPNYVASMLHFFGNSFIDSFKLQMFFASLIGSIFFYLWSKRYWGIAGGIVSAVLYTYTPYRFVDIYIRGSVGEVWAISLLPVLLYTTDKYFEKRSFFYLGLSAILLALIIFSHNILGLLFTLFYVTYATYVAYVNYGKKKLDIFKSIFSIILLGVGLSAIFWLPALWEEKYVTGLKIYNISENFPEAYQLILPSWGTGFSDTDNLGDRMSMQIGVANIIAVIVGFIVYIRSKKHKKNLLFCLIWFLLVVFLMLRVSLHIWEYIPFITYFQFPWRLLSIIVITAPFIAGSIVLLTKRRTILAALIIFAILISVNYTKPAYYHDRSDDYYIARDNFIRGTNSPGNLFNTIWMKKDLPPADWLVSSNEREGKIDIHEDTSTKLSFFINTPEDLRISVAKAYFPGWKVYIDGKEMETKPNNVGLASFPLLKGSYKLDVKFEDTQIRQVASFISVVSLIAIVYIFLKRRIF